MNPEKIKYEKMCLHIKYIVAIALTIAAGSIAVRCYDVSAFVEKISFASTIASIILSVIAIIMTINSETKSENTKDKLEIVSNNLCNNAEDIRNATEKFTQIIESNKDLKDLIENQLKYTVIGNNRCIRENVEERALDSEDKKSDEINYIEIIKKIGFNSGIQNQISLIALLYYMIKKVETVGIQVIEYREYERDFININNQCNNYITYSFVWPIGFIFTNIVFKQEDKSKTDKFKKYIEDRMKNEATTIKNIMDNSFTYERMY